MIVDSDVLIWYFRGNEKAKKIIDKLGSFNISIVTHMELLQGMRNKQELNAWKSFLAARKIECLPLEHDICSRATYFLELYALSNGLRMADAFIAATVDVRGDQLLTGNHADYKFIKNVNIKRFAP